MSGVSASVSKGRQERRDWSAVAGGWRMTDGGGVSTALLGRWRGQVQRFGREEACSAADRSMSIRCASWDDRLRHYKSSIEITSVPPTETIPAWDGKMRQSGRDGEKEERRRFGGVGRGPRERHRQNGTVRADSAPPHHPRR